MNRPSAAITVDIDGLSCYREIHGLPSTENAADPAYTHGVRRLLDFLESADIPATLFVIGRDLSTHEHAEIVMEAYAAGHEIGNHSYSHDYALRDQGIVAITNDILAGGDAIETVTGCAPVGFRTPGYNVSSEILRVCESHGYLYDSSLFPCPPYYLAKAGIMGWRAATGQPSRSSMTRIETLTAPIVSYHPNVNKPWRRGNSKLIEVPMCLVPGVRFPIIGTSLQLLKPAGFDLVWPAIRKVYRNLLNLEFHAIDFMDERDPGCAELAKYQPDLKIPWEEKREIYRHVFGRLRESYMFTTLEDGVRKV